MSSGAGWLSMAIAAAGCLSKPEAPAGDGSIGTGSFLLRHQVDVGDLDGDGVDDLVTWGNGDGPLGRAPQIRVHFGLTSRGLTAAPDQVIDMTFDGDLPWREVLDVAIVADRHEVVFVTAEDLRPRDSVPPRQRQLHSGLIPVAGQRLGEKINRSLNTFPVEGYADAPAPAFVVEPRPISTTPRQIVFGGSYDQAGTSYRFLLLADVDTVDSSSAATGGNFLYGSEGNAGVMQEVFPVPSSPMGEDLVVISRRFAYRSSGEQQPALNLGTGTAMGGDCARLARGRLVQSTFYAVVSCEGSSIATVVTSAAAGAPGCAPLQLAGAGAPTDLAIGDIAGNAAAPEIVTLEGTSLAVYGDVVTGAAATSTWTASTDVDGYDLLAVGHFRGTPTGEIYLLSRTDPAQPPLCFVVDPTAGLASCG